MEGGYEEARRERGGRPKVLVKRPRFYRDLSPLPGPPGRRQKVSTRAPVLPGPFAAAGCLAAAAGAGYLAGRRGAGLPVGPSQARAPVKGSDAGTTSSSLPASVPERAAALGGVQEEARKQAREKAATAQAPR